MAHCISLSLLSSPLLSTFGAGRNPPPQFMPFGRRQTNALCSLHLQTSMKAHGEMEQHRQKQTTAHHSLSAERWGVQQLLDCIHPHSARLLKLTTTSILPICLQYISLTLLCFCSRQQPTLYQLIPLLQGVVHWAGNWHGLFAPLCPLQKRK